MDILFGMSFSKGMLKARIMEDAEDYDFWASLGYIPCSKQQQTKASNEQ